MKITVLVENSAARAGLRTEHGLSLYIEACGRRILFDAGQSGAFRDNAETLGIDLAAVELAVLSHGHYDHGGGLEQFFRVNGNAECYVNPLAFGAYYNASGKYIGLEPGLREKGRFRFVTAPLEIGSGLTLYPGSETPPPTASGLTRALEGRRIPDDFGHEQYLLIEEGEKKVLISGCSHRGVAQIMERFQPDVLIGGFHTKDIPDGEALDALARQLAAFPADYYTCHCTGQMQYARMEQILGDRLCCLGTGDCLIL